MSRESYKENEQVNRKHKRAKNEQTNLKNFMFITMLSILCYSVGYALIYRITWDLGELVFPEAEYPYVYQFLFSIVILLVVFIIALKLVFNMYNKLGKNLDDF